MVGIVRLPSQVINSCDGNWRPDGCMSAGNDGVWMSVKGGVGMLATMVYEPRQGSVVMQATPAWNHEPTMLTVAEG
jgi:hypothetical protein